MMDLNKIIKSAQSSNFGLWKFNFILHRVIPFNKPHNLKVVHIDSNKVVVNIPYKKSNLNHIKGLHACVQATAAEYASGLLLLSRLGSHFRALDLFLALGTAYDFEMQNCSTSADWLALEEGVVALESRRSDAIIQCLKNSLRLTEAVKNTRTS